MPPETPIPFLDLITPHRELEGELMEVFRIALQCAGFIGGPMVQAFEEAFASFCETKYCVGVASGTDALRFGLMAAGILSGSIVVTVPNTFIATTEAISQAGAIPHFVDIDELTCNMDPEKLREYLETQCILSETTGQTIHKNTRRPVTAVVPVHLYGQPADMDPILALAERYHLLVIEDACQAHGAEYFSERQKTWKKAGSLGQAAAFSFYPGKNLGACGEAGAVTTNDEEIARKVRILRDHGQSTKYYHDVEGYNGRLDAIQAGILKVKLEHLPFWNEKRRELARHYHELLGSVSTLTVPFEAPWAKSVYHLYVIRTPRRDDLQAHLAAKGIATALHYPLVLHRQKAYCGMGYGEGSFPVAERVSGEILSLPMYPQLNIPQLERVSQAVVEFSRSL